MAERLLPTSFSTFFRRSRLDFLKKLHAKGPLKSPLFNGIFTGLALPPINLIFLFFFGMGGLLKRLSEINSTQWRTACKVGFFFGLGYHVVTLYWVALSMHVSWEAFWPLFIPALLGIPAGISLLTAMGMGFLVRFTPPTYIRRLAFPLIWISLEIMQRYLFTGFPWNPVGLAYSPFLSAMQGAAIVGIDGLSFLLLISLIVWPSTLSWRPITASFLIFFLPFLYGNWRLATTPISTDPETRLVLIQPNTPQTLKFDPDFVRENFQQLTTMTAEAIGQLPTPQKADLIFWPEAATAFDFQHHDQARALATASLGPRQYLLTGFVRQDPQTNNVHNSFGIFSPQGTLATYDKSHLVPFGEYIPLRQWMPSSLEKLTHGAIDFTPGKGPQTIDLKQEKIPLIGPLVCYEVVFSGAVCDPKKRPNLLVNITNDGWYLNSSGPYQHLEHSRLRAIEEGLPLVRIASTGISTVFDPLGQDMPDLLTPTTTRLPYGEPGTLITALPHPLPASPWSRQLCFFLLVGLYFMGCVIFYAHRRHHLIRVPI
ncbi:apolipoprotein N-acyltransferase [Alphaproteobacteria bacterium]|nr:apolipoprotein N-acyltransferase [Alphaproteobacteria bacterium]